MRRPLLFFLVAFVLAALVYRRAPTAFLRAESGWYLAMSHSDETTQRTAVRNFFTGSYGGHYTPLAFLSEFTMAKFAGTSRAFWRWRQLLAVAAVGAAVAGLVIAITQRLGLSRAHQLAGAGALGAITIFQPAMVDFVTWPFMILQLTWLGLSIAALYCSIRTVSAPRASIWPWLAAGAAYASLHVSGLGLVTVAATAGSLLWCAFIAGEASRRERLRLIWPCAAVVLLALLHAVMMLHPMAVAPAVGRSASLASTVQLGLGFIFTFFLAGLRSFTFLTTAVPHAASIAYCWPFGLLLVVGGSAGIYRYLRRTLLERTLPRTITALLLVYSAIGFAATVALIAGRQMITGPDSWVVLPYFTVMPRYVIPLQFLFLGPVIAGLAVLAQRVPRLVLIACCAIVPAALAAQVTFQKSAMPFLTTGTRVSHYTCWRLLVEAARECRAAGLPLPNFSMAPLTREFSEADVRTFLPLLHHDLKLAPGETVELVPVEEYRRDPARYGRAASVKRFENKLELASD
ncbi:MAG TPA: hypothetical protein VM940_16040 [Chthoniobacterales bacterium]|nr:hypothetical protein [Chthoniobacterales bacterium]